jgi:hypothetical protein
MDAVLGTAAIAMAGYDAAVIVVSTTAGAVCSRPGRSMVLASSALARSKADLPRALNCGPPAATVTWSPASQQVPDQHVCVSHMWLTSGATGSVLASGQRRPAFPAPLWACSLAEQRGHDPASERWPRPVALPATTVRDWR